MSTEPTPTDLEKEASAEASAAPETAGAPEEPADAADPAPSLARRTVTRIGHGGRNAGASLRHVLTTGNQSDDEIRRLLVQRQFGAYEEVRDTAREELDVVHSRITRLERIGAEDGWTPEQRQEVKVLREERKGRASALKDLMKAPFEPIQPTADQIKRARRAGSTRRFVALLVVIGLLGALLVSAPQLLLLALPVAVAVLWWLGRRPPTLVQRPVPDRLLAQPALALSAQGGVTAAGVEEEPAPYAIADASTSEEAEEALRRAIVREGGELRDVIDGRREPWGWSARARFLSGSPEALNEDKVYRNLITTLRLRRNGLLIEVDPESGDVCDVRMLLRDPFTPELVGTVPYRPPLSAAIRDPFDLGVGMDTTKLMFSLAGLMLLMVGDSGSGKSGVMLAMAEAATSTRDAVVINIDPVGTGVGELGPAITLNAYMDQDRIAAVFDFLIQLCSARARQRMAYGWGNKWRVSEEHPAMCVFVDEWPQLSEKNKKKLIKLLLLARKEAIWFYAGSQFGTKEHLGEAIGPKLKGKLLGASRRVDVTELLGGGAIAEGYRPDLLQAATETDPGDAGQIYAHGLPGMANRPTRFQVREITPEHAARVGAERAAAGLPDVTHTLTEAGMIKEWNKLLKAEGSTAPGGPSAGGGDDEPDVPRVLLVIAEAFVQEDDPEYLTLDQLHRYLRKDDVGKWGRWDDRDDQGRLRELGKAVARELRNAKVDLASDRIREAEGQPRGFYANAVQRALANGS